MRALAPRLALAGTALLLAAVLVEGGARLWLAAFANDAQFSMFASLEQQRDRRGPGRYVAHPYLGYVPTPNYERGANRHNALGFRGADIVQPKPAGEYRIVCLGGSSTYTSLVEDWREAYPAQLERALRQTGHDQVRVVNAGVEGYASYESLVNLQFRVLDLDPDLVVVYHAVNDVLARLVWPPEAYRGDNTGAIAHAPGPRPPTGLDRSSALRILRVARGWALPAPALQSTVARVADTGYAWPYILQVEQGAYPAGQFTEVAAEQMLARNAPGYFARNLTSLVATARAHDVKVVLATFARIESPDHGPLATPPITAAIDASNEVVRSVGAATATPVYDFAREFPEDPALFVDGVHLTAAGARLKGERFAAYLLGQSLLRP